jgi:hypothetical protein
MKVPIVDYGSRKGGKTKNKKKNKSPFKYLHE